MTYILFFKLVLEEYFTIIMDNKLLVYINLINFLISKNESRLLPFFAETFLKNLQNMKENKFQKSKNRSKTNMFS